MTTRIAEKIKAIRVAESCIHTVLSINPTGLDTNVLTVLAELKLDLMDMMEQPENFDVLHFLDNGGTL